jgi:hypothetical protein
MNAERAEAVAKDCLECAAQYAERPGMAGALTMIDLYRTIARLARIIERQQNQLDHLMPDKSSDI